MLAPGHQIAEQDDRDERRNDLEHEHDRLLDERPWIKLDEGRADRRPDDLGIEQGRGGGLLADVCGVHGSGSKEFDQNSVFARIANCSTMGPSASAGKKVRPPTMTITPATSPTNRPPVVGNVPA